MKGSEPGSLVDVLRLRATEQPDKRAYTFLPDGEAQEACITYSELDQQARSIAASLQSMGASGKPALLLYPPGVNYIVAFLGCLYAGVIAVPTYPPRLNRSLARLHGIVADSQATLALTKSSVSLRPEIVFVESLGPKSPKLLATDEIDPQLADQWQEPDLGTETLAFLQYTSGSTSAPKGVMVTHGNLLHNQRMIQNVFGQDEQSVIVGWLPLYHDMGLIGNVLQPLYIGASCILMSPVSFLQRPFRWLKAISSYSATTSGGPNFAYDLCSHKIAEDQLAELDLSSWRVAFNGSEPVRRETLDRFAARFGPCGFRREAFSPCYGLAEATLLVSGTPKAALPAVKSMNAKRLELNRVVESESIGEGDITLVSSGQSPADLKIVIAHPESLTRCEPGEVGEIWISGQSIAKGYWNRPEQTEETFQARLADTGEGPFLRTGDLGFLHNGELFVTGRIKDLIIIRGLNHYPQDIEATVERCHPGLRPGGSAVFCVNDAGEEKLVVVQEVRRNKQIDLDAVIQTIRQAVAQEHEIQAHAVLLTKPHHIPKTSSGKVQRHACRSTFLEGSFDVLAQWRAADAQEGEATGSPTAPAEDAESITAWLKSRFAATLGVEPSSINATQPISRLGLDSLQVIQLTQDIETNTGLSLPMVTLMEGITVAELACEISAQLQTTRSAPSLSAGP